MTFLNPFVLFGLAAASLPVLFHLFARRRSRRVEFSSLRFLQKLEKTSMRAVKLRQWLLLLIRTLLIACLVMAFARPALRGYLGSFFGASHANSSVVYLIDNSASMTRSDESGALLVQAKRSAQAIAGLMQQGDEATVIPLASLERGKEYTPLHTKQDVLRAIEDVRAADRPAELDDGLRVASAVLSRSVNVNKELYLLTDAQSRNLRSRDTSRKDTAAMRLFDPSTRIFETIVGHGEEMSGKNLALDSLKPVTTIFEPGRPVQFEAWVHTTSRTAVQNVALSLFYNSERVGQTTIASVGVGSTERVTIQGPLRGSGLIEVKAELEPDALPFDNSRYTVLDIPSSRRIALYTSDPQKASFLQLALSQTLEASGQSMPFTIDLKRPDELRTLPAIASHYDAAIVLWGPGIGETDREGLKAYVDAGHGAAIFLMPGLDASANQQLAALGLPQITTKTGQPTGDATHYLSFAQFELSHPFFSGMFEAGQGGNRVRGIESPHIFENYGVSLSRGIPLIKLSNGNPYLVELTVGKGDVLFYTVPPTFDFSDLPRRSIFLPLMRRTAAYASAIKTARDENQQPAFVTTEPFQIELPQLAGEQTGATLLIKSPDGSSMRSKVSVTSDGKPFIRLEEARVAGNYTVYRDAEAREPIAAFAVNVESDEADIKTASEKQMVDYLAARTSANRASIKSLKPDERTIATAVQQSRYGVELWQSFLYAAIILALLEMLIAREAKRQVVVAAA
jgi:hypothetical protein